MSRIYVLSILFQIFMVIKVILLFIYALFFPVFILKQYNYHYAHNYLSIIYCHKYIFSHIYILTGCYSPWNKKAGFLKKEVYSLYNSTN